MKQYIVKHPKIKNILYTTASALFWVGLWWFASFLINKEVVLPSPVAVIMRLFINAAKPDFWIITFLSLLRIIIGFLSALILGIIISFLSYYIKIFRTLFSPIINIFKAAPVASFIILLYIWLSTNIIPAVTAFIIVLPIIWENIHAGLNNTDKNLNEVCEIYRIKGFKKIKLFYIPSIKPYLSAAVLSSFGMAWKAGVAAEVLTTPKYSIGKQLYNAKIYLESADLFAWTVVIIVISFIIERIFIKRLKKKI
ncbi:MAG: hypothetical protein A2Y17_12850 [Clostridiales bacterium GWF2_38_85]|nr:MAG: hypothetical protein A2Y17_12850 [Clostridiales bacterium GWF2_38_85]HBL84148.1 nitrate ABC transporter permease [Clostridiales bacterium]